MPAGRSVLIVRPPRRRDRAVGQGLQYVDAPRRHPHPEHQKIFASRTPRILSDRELKEGTARCLARHQIGHLGVQTLRIRKCELDPVGSILRGGPTRLRKSSSNSIRRKG